MGEALEENRRVGVKFGCLKVDLRIRLTNSGFFAISSSRASLFLVTFGEVVVVEADLDF